MVETGILSLTDFLLARIAEDEAAFRWGRLTPDPDDPAYGILRWDDERGRAECEAKRRIVEASEHHARYDDGALGDHCRANLALLAAVYVDHPDFREEWKP